MFFNFFIHDVGKTPLGCKDACHYYKGQGGVGSQGSLEDRRAALKRLYRNYDSPPVFPFSPSKSVPHPLAFWGVG